MRMGECENGIRYLQFYTGDRDIRIESQSSHHLRQKRENFSIAIRINWWHDASNATLLPLSTSLPGRYRRVTNLPTKGKEEEEEDIYYIHM